LYSCKRYKRHLSSTFIFSSEKRAYLDLNIEHRLRVDLDAQSVLHIICKALLVAQLDGSPLLLEARVVDVLQQALYVATQPMSVCMSDGAWVIYFELVEILKELGLRNAKGFLDEVAQTGIALVQPATGSNYEPVREVSNGDSQNHLLPLVTLKNLDR
jgi:hypothetical protein